jgi:hypothetical protein
MGMSRAFDPIPDRQETKALIRTAVEHGITFFRAAEVYAAFTNENRFTGISDHGCNAQNGESFSFSGKSRGRFIQNYENSEVSRAREARGCIIIYTT